jgi:hypothetical protein
MRTQGRTRRITGLLTALAALVASGAVTTGAVADPARTTVAAAPAAGREQAGTATGREQAGIVEPVVAVVGYRGGDRSVTLHHPGAEYVKVHFSRLLLLPGDHVTVADPDGTEVHRYESGPLLGLGTLIGGAGRWAMSVTGDTAVVTLHRSAPDPLGLRATVAGLGAVVDRVARGLTAAERATRRAETGREESVCASDGTRDAVCYARSEPAMYRRTKAVARLLINGTELCTAFRVGRGNRLLTNHHCIRTSAQAFHTEVWFNYQCATCGGYEVFRFTKVWADRVLATDDMLDFSLFTVADFDQVRRFGHLRLDPRPAAAGEELYVPQHPAGEPTRVALSTGRDRSCAVVDPAADGYDWGSDVSYYCDTEGGSSGSPVLSRRTDRVLALHHFGGCPNSGVRIELIYPHIRPYL